MSLSELRKKISKQKNSAQALVFQRFFKTGKDKYGVGAFIL